MDRGFAARLYPAAAKEPSPTLTAIVQYPPRKQCASTGRLHREGCLGGARLIWRQSADGLYDARRARRNIIRNLRSSGQRSRIAWLAPCYWRYRCDSTWRFSSGLPFAVEGASIDTNVAVADIGLDLGLSPGSKLALRYSSQIGADSFENNLSARLDIRF